MKSITKRKLQRTERIRSKASEDPLEYNRIKELFASSRFDEAEEAMGRYISRYPQDVDAWNLRGMIARSQLRYEKAIEYMEEALRLAPRNPVFWNNIGAVYKDAGDVRRAIDAFLQAVSVDPNHADALYNLGYSYHQTGQYSLARDYYNRSLENRPGYENAIENLVALDKEQGNIQQAAEGYQRIIRQNPNRLHSWSNMLLCMNYLDSIHPSELYQRHLDFGKHFETIHARIHVKERDVVKHRKLRVGFVSADFRTHSIAFFLMPLLVAYDRRRFTFYGYSAGHVIDETTQKMQALMDHWRNIYSLTDEQVSDMIQEDHIDILIDLSGHTGFCRLDVFLRKPAPIQVTWLGYPNTTGLTRIDYRITDAWTDPEPNADSSFTERLIRLPSGFLCYQAPTDLPEPNPLPARTTGQVTFGSFNNHVKISPSTVRIWSSILQRIPSARLVLKSSFPSDPVTKDRILKAFEAQGVSTDRIQLLDKLPLTEHFRAYHQMDIALDTIPYNGTTTTCEALYMGVPVLALEGLSHASRVSAGILARIGLTDWIAKTEEEYVELAVRKAEDIEGLATLRQELRNRMSRSPLMDRSLFAAEMQEAFRFMWRRYCDEHCPSGGRRLIFLGAMQPEDAVLMSRAAEALLTFATPGTEIEGIMVSSEQDWDREIGPLLKNGNNPSRPMVVQCRNWLPQVENCLSRKNVCGFYMHRRPEAEDAQLDHHPIDGVSVRQLRARNAHDSWMRLIPAVTVFRRVDWDRDPKRMIALMAVRMGIDMGDEIVANIAERLFVSIGQKGTDDMGYDRTYKDMFLGDSNGSETISLKSFRFSSETIDHAPADGSKIGFIEGYDHPDAEDIAFGDRFWISLPKGDVSSETIQIRCAGHALEPELELLRRCMRPGSCGIDIGSGYGLYSMTAAMAAGPRSTFWAFEPDRTRWAFCMRSITLSAMHQIRLMRVTTDGLASKPTHMPNDPEPIPYIRLDEAMRRYDMPDIDWIRMGEGVDIERVLDGGRDCFSLNSPLVQVAIGQGGEIPSDFLKTMQEWGYDIYHMVPGLDCLAPYGSKEVIEAVPKHLFWCKPDRAAQLASWNVLVRHEIDAEATGRSHPSLWLDLVRQFPYAIRLIHLWEGYLTHHLKDPAWRVHQEAMSCYALSRMKELPLEDRWQALGRAHRLLIDLLAKQASFSRLLSMARVSSEMGYEAQAEKVLRYLLHLLETGNHVSIDEPFLLPNERLDSVDPGESIGNMILTAILDALERVQNRMGQWTAAENVERIELMRTLPFYDKQFEERRNIVR